MNKFFYSLLISFTFTSFANAQTAEQQKRFIIQAFPGYMPEYVLANATIVPVNRKYAKKHKTIYQYTNLAVPVYQGSVRAGDTLVVFNGQAFYSKGQNLFMLPTVEQNNTKTAKAPKVPKSPEQKAQETQAIIQIAGMVIPTVIQVATKNNSIGNYGGTGRGLVRIGG